VRISIILTAEVDCNWQDVRDARIALQKAHPKLTHDAIAKRVGLSSSYLYKLEKGEKDSISIDTAKCLEQVLNINLGVEEALIEMLETMLDDLTAGDADIRRSR
jgi:transcriptional regulator with XRE-family HTH domain